MTNTTPDDIVHIPLPDNWQNMTEEERREYLRAALTRIGPGPTDD